MRQERALNRIARNEDVTEWRRDSICSSSLDKPLSHAEITGA